MTKEYTYNDAFEELQAIVNAIETGETSVDELTEKIRRASELILICKTKLTASEEEVDKLLAQLVNNEKSNTDALSEEE
ncbi:exodeoxyribonuclease VII small subunit [Sphingobacterium sp. UT-1RO-CII-1]|uniref:exodeoxyribonuclease VII small subunit n=1 Tax=Sphingobacterium sp. UT-1RO-CII-1 TaxID=2995225 RepID=UPI00227B3E93|nr:exodeoxyribonuclease VII small subunit [Sphingobacterium sp. UT-1RO-CII-1]MCY4778621.1 exodeoxyribonuclease VII small subunit [Sphingobacterium sp. UT-1RO-CII-1]